MSSSSMQNKKFSFNISENGNLISDNMTSMLAFGSERSSKPKMKPQPKPKAASCCPIDNTIV